MLKANFKTEAACKVLDQLQVSERFFSAHLIKPGARLGEPGIVFKEFDVEGEL